MRDMKNQNKIQVQINNEIYELSAKALRNYQGRQYIYVSHADAGSLVKQFVKKMYKNQDVVVKVKSDSFAGGNSLDVYVHNKIGGQVSEKIFNEINQFANLWEYGKFNGMYDIYEDYESSGAKTDKGMELQAGVKYVHVNNRPRFGTVEAILNEVLNEGRAFSQVVKYYTDSSTKMNPAKAKTILVGMGIEVK